MKNEKFLSRANFAGGGKATNANLTTRNTTIKKDKEIFDQQRLSLKSSTNNSSTGGLNLGVKDELEEFSDEYEDEEFSYSLSGQSTPIPPTPEPTKTPTPTITAEMFLKSPSPHCEKVCHRLNEVNVNVAGSAQFAFLIDSEHYPDQVIVRPVHFKGRRTIFADQKDVLHRLRMACRNSHVPFTVRETLFFFYFSHFCFCFIQKNDKTIPRLSESPDLTEVDCLKWTVDDVAEFLRVNDCPAHANAFIDKDITGDKMLKLTNNEIITMIGLKVGPALKIYDLIQQLRSKMRPHQSRQIKAKFL